MASESTHTSETTGKGRGTNGSDVATARREPIQAAVNEVRDALQGVGRSVPEVARASRAAATDLFHAIETGSDERVQAGVTFSLGLAIGMLVGGAPRLLIALTLVPLAAMGMVLADRRVRPTRSTSS
jgi:hypothetical protein